MKNAFKVIKIIFLILVVLIILGGVAIFHFGLFPKVSDILGVNRVRDLGVKYSPKNYGEFNQEAKIEIRSVDEGKSATGKGVEFVGKTDINQGFTQEDISARLNYSTWKYMPVSNTQIKINPDGSVEFSANLNTDRLPGFIEAVGGVSFSQSDVDQALAIVNKISSHPSIYSKFTASVANNDISVHVSTLQVGGMAVPLDKLGGDAAVKALAEHIFTLASGLDVQSLDFNGGKMNFKGTAPSMEIVPTN